MSVRVFSYGGGVQSTAALVLAAEGRIDFRTFLFANTGDDSEHPATLAYVHDVAMPYAAANGLDLQELRRRRRSGEVETLRGRIMNATGTTHVIPIRLTNGKPGGRSCTADFKIRVVDKWLREAGVTKTEPATVGIGISTDEIQRAHPGIDERNPRQDLVYPLLDLGLARDQCAAIIGRVLPVPPKSACYFCPYHKPSQWRAMKRDEPELFAKSVEIEQAINARMGARGLPPVWLTDFLRPLDEAISPDGDQLALPFDGGDCDSGHCMT